MADRFRTFVAVELPDEIREELVRLRGEMDCGELDVRWSDPRTMHLTLKSLGDVSADSIGEVVEACRRAAAGCAEPPEIAVGGLILFPSPDRPKVVAAHAEGGEPLRALQAAVEGELSAIGYPPEGRGWNPHVTVGRVKTRGRGKYDKARDAKGQSGALPIGRVEADEVVVFQSELRPEGAEHAPLARIKLGPRHGG